MVVPDHEHLYPNWQRATLEGRRVGSSSLLRCTGQEVSGSHTDA